MRTRIILISAVLLQRVLIKMYVLRLFICKDVAFFRLAHANAVNRRDDPTVNLSRRTVQLWYVRVNVNYMMVV